jgi:hypothetical protein
MSSSAQMDTCRCEQKYLRWLVMHDINFVHRPKDLPWLTAKYYNYFFPKVRPES